MNNWNAQTNPIPHPREAAFSSRPPKPQSHTRKQTAQNRDTRDQTRTQETNHILETKFPANPPHKPYPARRPPQTIRHCAIHRPTNHREETKRGGERRERFSPGPGGPPPRRSPEPDIDRSLGPLFSSPLRRGRGVGFKRTTGRPRECEYYIMPKIRSTASISQTTQVTDGMGQNSGARDAVGRVASGWER